VQADGRLLEDPAVSDADLCIVRIPGQPLGFDRLSDELPVCCGSAADGCGGSVGRSELCVLCDECL